MDELAAQDELLAHLERITRLTRGEIGKVVSEALAFYAESVDEFVAGGTASCRPTASRTRRSSRASRRRCGSGASPRRP
jgi:hypothetical protein